ncbi:protein MAIN-LIKE 2-like [Arachis hypogaea]|uniref:protein MAIN-LIKE 2-like n=1 Tax=Arachis hypogaea TaxID=3818 RepID=UPI003B2269F5
MLICDHFLLPDPYNPIVEAHLWETDFYHVSHIGVVQCQSAMINTLIKRWQLETRTFYFLVGECAVSLKDVAMILSLPTNRIPVIGPTMSSFEALEAECLHHFGVALRKMDCRGSFIKLTWIRGLKDCTVLTNDIQIQRYVKCHIMLLFGTILFADKSGAAGNSCRLQGDGWSTYTFAYLGLDPSPISCPDSWQSPNVSDCKQVAQLGT